MGYNTWVHPLPASIAVEFRDLGNTSRVAYQPSSEVQSQFITLANGSPVFSSAYNQRGAVDCTPGIALRFTRVVDSMPIAKSWCEYKYMHCINIEYKGQ